MHLNDSKGELRSKKDRHENIGLCVAPGIFPADIKLTNWCISGHLSLHTFQHILKDTRLHDIPLILETPSHEQDEVWKTEVEVLNRLSLENSEPGSQEDKQLLETWRSEVKQVVQKAAGAEKKPTKSKKGKGGQKSGKAEVDESDEE